MKRTMRIAVSVLLMLTVTLSLFAAGAAEKEGKKVINLWSFTDEVPNMMKKFKELNPDFDYEFETTIIATTDGAYMPALDQALAGGGANAPDIYCAEAAFVLKYTQGDAAHFAAPYKDLGINVDAKLREADIAAYT
ncbi:MAG TPA: carbohydrate ABC transporter substrate-binding protein, partial [Sphaerochaeta sp.]|nr:carbohydrate ABC transporter substrate-binding protein [Sphaerochaeta sp.]